MTGKVGMMGYWALQTSHCLQSVYARTIYRPSDILFNRRYQVHAALCKQSCTPLPAHPHLNLPPFPEGSL